MPEAFICDAVRTPIGRYGGTLAALRPDDLAAVTLRAVVERSAEADWEQLDDVVMGCTNQAGEDNRNIARMALLLAGLPHTVPGTTVNRLCASGLDATAVGARAIKSGESDLIVAGGVESMSRAPFVMPKADAAFSRTAKLEDTTIGWRFVNPAMARTYGIDSMGETAENVAEKFQISRTDQDAYALRSQQRAAVAGANGRLAREIVPVTVPARRGDDVTVGKDEHPRPNTDAAALARLKPAFREGGSVTAGNAAGVNDGAAALIVASEPAAKRHGLTPRARIVAAAAAGVLPRIMGIGPVPASQKALERAGLKLEQIDVVELNEAFASQVLASLRQLGLPDDAEHVNRNGGAIALGHPLGMTGARLVLTAIEELHEHKTKYALCTMCVGVGQGAAMILERV